MRALFTMAAAMALILSAQAAQAQTSEITIGISISTTGPAAALGVPERNALEFVPKEIAGVKVARVRSDDGFKFYLEDGSWVLFRTSGTEALIRIYSEAADAAAVEARLAAIEAIVGLKKEADVRA